MLSGNAWCRGRGSHLTDLSVVHAFLRVSCNLTGVAAEPMIPAMNAEAQGGRSAVVDLLADLVAAEVMPMKVTVDDDGRTVGEPDRASSVGVVTDLDPDRVHRAIIDAMSGEPADER